MRRFLAFVVLLACSVPVGFSISGCGHNPNNYCIKNGHAYGVLTTQVVYATLQPETTGSLWHGGRLPPSAHRRALTATISRNR